jgi:hypothetical protein
MANILYANNAAGTLASGITNASTSLTLNAGQAALFPVPSSPQVFYVTLTDAATQTLIEIVKVTAVSGNIFSIVRAQDGTSALSWNANDIVSQRTIRLELQGFENAAEGLFGAQAVAITPSTTLGIVGTTLGDNANAGAVGEYISATAGPFTLATSSPFNGVVISLTAGDWDVSGVIDYAPSGGASLTIIFASINTISGALPGFQNLQELSANFLTGNGQVLATPVVRISSAVPVSVFAVGQASFTGGSVQATSFIRARRVR